MSQSPHGRTRRTTLALIASATALVAPASASAMTAAGNGTTLSITDQAGHNAVVTVGQYANVLNLPSLDKVVVTADSAITGTVSGCTHPTVLLSTDPNTIVCDHSAYTKVSFDLGDGNDQLLAPSGLSVLGINVLPFTGVRIDAQGGTGNDTLTGGASSDALVGGDGDDTISGADGDDTITAGLGEDFVYPGAGSNTVDTSGLELDHVYRTAGSNDTVNASANDEIVGGTVGLLLNLVGQILATPTPTATPAPTPTATPAPGLGGLIGGVIDTVTGTVDGVVGAITGSGDAGTGGTTTGSVTVGGSVTATLGLPSITDILSGNPSPRAATLRAG